MSAFHKTDISKEALKDTSFEYITTSGIYDVTIETLSVETNKKGARSLNLNVDYKGSKTTIYGLRLDNNDGSANFGRAIFNKLCIIAGIDSVEAPEEQTHILGKDKVPTQLQVLDQFSDLLVKIRLGYSYHMYNGKIQERRDIKAFYRAEDGATANEIASELPAGEQLLKDMKYATDVTYKDGLTKEDIDEWKKPSSKPSAQQPQAKTQASANLFS